MASKPKRQSKSTIHRHGQHWAQMKKKKKKKKKIKLRKITTPIHNTEH